MNERDILKLVLDMRTAQNKYFRTLAYDDLYNSKILESKVDKALRDIFIPNNQLNIFSQS